MRFLGTSGVCVKGELWGRTYGPCVACVLREGLSLPNRRRSVGMYLDMAQICKGQTLPGLSQFVVFFRALFISLIPKRSDLDFAPSLALWKALGRPRRRAWEKFALLSEAAMGTDLPKPLTC